MTDAPYHRELERGDVLDEAYRVVRLIAQGGMGHVYEAEQLRLDRRVALKILSVDPKKSGEFLPRFRREAEICAKLAHPNIIAVLDWNVAHGMPYLVMEYLEGEDLGIRINRGPLDLGEALYILDGIAAGLIAAHAHGVVHRDLKPSNVFLCNVGMLRPHVKLLDFGVSKVAWETTLSTTSPKVLGSPRYMAPEQARGEPNIDARVDQFALGTVAYEMFAGAFAFDGDSLSSVLYRVVHEPPPPLASRAPHLPEHVVRSIGRAMEKDPAKRFDDVAQFVAALHGKVPPDVAHKDAERTNAFSVTELRQPVATSSSAARSPTEPVVLTQVKHSLPARTIGVVAIIALALAFVLWRVDQGRDPDAPPAPAPVPAPTPVAPDIAPPPAPPPPTAGSDTLADSAAAEHKDVRKTSQAPDPRPRPHAPKNPAQDVHVAPAGGDAKTPVSHEQAQQVQRLIDEAQKLYNAGEYRETVVRARQALGYADAPRAHVLIVLAYCRLGSVGDAHAEMFGVRAQDKPSVVAACNKLGVDVSD